MITTMPFFEKLRRLFGKRPQKLELLDTVALAVFFIILGLTAWFFLRRAEYVDMTIKISDANSLQNAWVERETPEWYIENLSTDLEEKNIFGVSNIKVERVYYYPTLENVETVYVDLRVRAVFNRNTQQYSYRGTPLLIGSWQNIPVSGVRIAGILTQLGDDTERNTRELIVRGELETQDNELIQYPAETSFEGVKVYIAEKITEGLTVTDSDGRVVAEVLDVSLSPAYRSFPANNRVVRAPDPERRNVDLAMKIQVEEINGNYFYAKEEAVFIDQILEFAFDDFQITMTIQEIEEL